MGSSADSFIGYGVEIDWDEYQEEREKEDEDFEIWDIEELLPKDLSMKFVGTHDECDYIIVVKSSVTTGDWECVTKFELNTSETKDWDNIILNPLKELGINTKGTPSWLLGTFYG